MTKLREGKEGSMENRRAPTQEEPDDYDAAGSVHLACEKAYYFFCALRDDTMLPIIGNDRARYEKQIQVDRARYETFRDEAIATALAIKHEIAHGLAIHEVLKLLRRTNQQFDLAKKLFKEVDDDGLRERILKDVPELAGEKKKRLSDEEKALRTVTINLDGLSPEAIISRVVKAMRDVGTPEREIECFKEDAVGADYATMLATAIGYQAPVRFIKDGKPWFRGDWRRLTPWQRVKRRVSLWSGGYVHPDGYIEGQFEKKSRDQPGRQRGRAGRQVRRLLPTTRHKGT
jgi:hypothetical protein